MKYMMIWIVLFASCLMATAEVSRDQLKDAKRLVKIAGMKEGTDRKKSGDCDFLKIRYSGKPEDLGGLYVRIAVEVTDQKEKEPYLIKQTQPFRSAKKYAGEGHWQLEIPHSSFDKIKISAYAVEFGLKDEGEFIPFDADYDDVDTYEELTERTTTPFPGKCKFFSVNMVKDLEDLRY